MYIPDFTYHKPDSINEACRILDGLPDAAVIAGGTDLLVEMKQGLRSHTDIISVNAIAEMKKIEVRGSNVSIGGAVTFNELVSSKVINDNIPVIAEAASKIATDQIRNTGTIGGNLCTGASCCDMAPALLALNAEIELKCTKNARSVPLENLFSFHRKTLIQKGEILTKILIKIPGSDTGSCFEKFGLREAASISVVSVGAFVEMDGEICKKAVITLGAVAAVPMSCEKAPLVVIGKKASELPADSEILRKAGEIAADEAEPIDDIRGSAEFRRELIKVLVPRVVGKAVERAASLRSSTV